ncbi:methyltransferase [Diaporthe amygdali]|uniref:methyltransferase n=1 Tax=Phomopsis amygdali TaxID=1214568 RepID=UPI0022FDE504|nr:methyltransferase [Diaporthe amygdali]KAJ0104267.1 methyltransferase [Diaporthe amygdali]
MTTGVFRYIDPATITQSEEPFIKPWAKVDTDSTSFERTERKRSVANIREAATNGTEFGVNVSGFAVYNYPSRVQPGAFFASDDSEVRSSYYAEVEQLLVEKLGPGVKKVVIFDHTIRKHDPTSPRQPVQQVHVDQTPKAAETRVRRHVPEGEADELLKGRYQLINVWRPIGHSASDFPLAVVDWRTTAPEDLVKVDLLYPTRNRGIGDEKDDRGKEILPDPEKAKDTTGYEVRGETYSIAPNEKHKFWYMKDMTPDEAMFIKCFDSGSQGQPNGQHGVAALTPHTAFIDPNTPSDAKGRQSIEVRCLVFYGS